MGNGQNLKSIHPEKLNSFSTHLLKKIIHNNFFTTVMGLVFNILKTNASWHLHLVEQQYAYWSKGFAQVFLGY